MKMWIQILTLSLLSQGAMASWEDAKVISEREVTIDVDVSKTQLRFTNAGYGDSFFVKILIPKLADVTLLDHRNEGEDAPCMATYDTVDTADVVQNNPAVIPTKMKITLTKTPLLNRTAKNCEIHLEEFIEGEIRGFKFFHTKSKVIDTRHVDDCR